MQGLRGGTFPWEAFLEAARPFTLGSVSTLGRTRVSGGSCSKGTRTQPGSLRQPPAEKPSTSWPANLESSGAVDHWSALLFYSAGWGTVAVAILFLLVLAACWLYAQFVSTFTHWDLADLRLKPFKAAAEFVLFATFAGGASVGLWCFSGKAWKRPWRQSAKPDARCR